MYGVGSASRLGVRAGGQLDRQLEDEARPALGVRDAQLAAHLARQLAADGQPEAEAALARRRAAALEALEDPLAIVGDDARARRRPRRPWRSRRGRRARRGRSRSPARGAGRCRAGCARRAPRRRVAAAPARPGRRGDLELDVGLAGAQLELGGHRAAQLAQLDGLLAQRHVGVEPAEVQQLAGQPRQAPQLALGAHAPGAGHPPGRDRPSRRSSSSSSIVPCSEVSGVRSSCEAVATNERRAASWRRSSRCMVASARARSPTSSRPSSRGVGASVPSSATRTAAARRRARRRPMPVASRCRAARPRARPTAAAARKALRTWLTAVVTSVSCFCVTSTKSPVEVGLRSRPG